jgi:hypothetical protein
MRKELISSAKPSRKALASAGGTSRPQGAVDDFQRPANRGRDNGQTRIKRLHKSNAKRFMSKFDLVKIKPQGLFDNGVLEFNLFFVRRGYHEHGRARLWKLINNVPSHKRLVTYGY